VLFENIRSKISSPFTDLKSYEKRLEENLGQNRYHPIRSVSPQDQLENHHMVVACMDFEFIGGSLGSVMGERISRAVDYCLAHTVRH